MHHFSKKVFVPELNREYTYELKSRTVVSDENEEVPVYGISVFENGKEDSLNNLYCNSVEDISTDFNLVNEIFEIIISEMLLPIHLPDVISDF